MRSTSVVLGLRRASETGINRPVPESRPRRLDLRFPLSNILTSFVYLLETTSFSLQHNILCRRKDPNERRFYSQDFS